MPIDSEAAFWEDVMASTEGGGTRRPRGQRTSRNSAMQLDNDWLDRQLTARAKAVDDARLVLPEALKFALVAGIRRGMVEGYSKILPIMAEHIAKTVPPPDVREAIHQRVGKQAQRSVLSSYGQRVTANQSAMSRSGYRKNAGRMAGGALRRALGRDDMIEATADHLRFINWQTLDKEAAHWYRLNFGAGPRGQRTKQARFEVFFGGDRVGELGFNTGPSVSPVIMPPGMFLNAEGGREKRDLSRRGLDAFMPIGAGGTRGRPMRSVVTKGIEARNFLDAGLRRIAKELPEAYDDYYRDSFARAHNTPRAVVDANLPALGIKVRTVKGVSAERRYRKGQPL